MIGETAPIEIAGPPPRRWIAVAHLGVIVVAVFVVFGGSLSNEFVWDDQDKIANFNEPLSAAGHLAFWTSRNNEAEHVVYFRPLAALTLMIDKRVWGAGPWGLRFSNLILHAVAMIVLYFLFADILGDRLFALFAVLFFGIHPLRAESVALIGNRTDILAAIFGGLALWVPYRLLRRSSDLGRAFAAAFIFGLGWLLALLCKEAALPLVVFAPLAFYRPIARATPARRTALLAAACGFAGLALTAYLLLRRRALGDASPAPDLRYFATHYPLFAWKYLSMNFFFQSLAPNHEAPETSLAGLAAAIGGWGVVLWLSLRQAARGWKSPLLGAAVFLFFLLPVSGIARLTVRIADCRTYLPSIGLAIFLGAAAGRIRQRTPRLKQLLVVSLLVILGFLAYCGAKQADLWRDSLTLWSATTPRRPADWESWTNLGVAAIKAGDNWRALAALERADKISGHHVADTIINLATCYELLQIFDRAEQLFAEVEEVPKFREHAIAHRAHAVLLGGDAPRARQILDEAAAGGRCNDECQRLRATLTAAGQ